MKFTSIFFTTSTSIFEVTSKIRINEQKIESLQGYFSLRVRDSLLGV